MKEQIINEFKSLSDNDKLAVLTEIEEITYGIMRVLVVDERHCSVWYNNKSYSGVLNDGEWNFWEDESNDLADEESSYDGDINDIDALKEYFDDYVYL